VVGGQVRCWEIQANGSSVPKAMQAHEQPVLCSAWNADGSTVYSGGCDNTVKAWNLATNQQQVGAPT
jgi:mRNA export factor